MELNRKNAMKAWEDQFGKIVQAVDFAGRKIQKGAYEQKTSDFGWMLTYLVPKNAGGSAKPENLLCVHVKTAEEKGDSYPAFFANEKKYNVKDEDGVRVEDPLFNPTMCHYSMQRRALKLYTLEDYSQDLYETHGTTLKSGAYSYDKMVMKIKEYIPEEFLTDYYVNYGG